MDGVTFQENREVSKSTSPWAGGKFYEFYMLLLNTLSLSDSMKPAVVPVA